MTDDKRDIKRLCNDYLFLTGEMVKFADMEDLALFEDLLRQRETLLGIIGAAADKDEYAASEEGRAVIKKIADMDARLREKVLLEKNNLTKSFNVSSAYDGFSGESDGVGSRFDSKGR